MNIPHYIKEALEYNDGNNQMSIFLRQYYTALLNKADQQKKIVQTNKDDGFIEIYETNKKYLNE
jgi:hypothetical protein